MSECLVSFANYESVRYMKNLNRLRAACEIYCPTTPLLSFTDYKEIGSPRHEEVNYGFKVYATRKALEAGFTKIIWLDSAVYPILPIHGFLDLLNEKEGLLFFDNIGLPLGEWVSDRCLAHYDIDRQFAMNLKQTMGCLFAFDINTPLGVAFWNKFEKDAINPQITNGAWTNEALQVSKNALVRGHRHDQSIASCILHQLSYKLVAPNKTVFAYKEWYKRLTISPNVCFNSESY